MSRPIAEGAMKHVWQIRRQTIPCPDGQQRWDRAYQHILRRAYQHILRWTATADGERHSHPPTTAPIAQEVRNDAPSGDLCPRLNPAPGPHANDRSATRAPAGV